MRRQSPGGRSRRGGDGAFLVGLAGRLKKRRRHPPSRRVLPSHSKVRTPVWSPFIVPLLPLEDAAKILVDVLTTNLPVTTYPKEVCIVVESEQDRETVQALLRGSATQ